MRASPSKNPAYAWAAAIFWCTTAIVLFSLWVIIPAATAGRFPSLYRWTHEHEDLTMALMFAPMPLVVVGGGLWVAFSQAAIAFVIIRRASPLMHAAAALRGAYGKDRAVLLPLGAAWAAVVLLFAYIGWRAVNLPGGALFKGNEGGAALLVILKPDVIAAYFLTAIVLLLSNAMLIQTLLDVSRGRPIRVTRAALSTLTRLGEIASLALILFGGMLVVQLFWEKMRGKVRPFGTMVGERIVAILLVMMENGALMGANAMIAVMLSEGGSLGSSAKRVLDMTRGRGRGDAIRALFGLTSISYEAPATLLVTLGMVGYFVPVYLGDKIEIWMLPFLFLCPALLVVLLVVGPAFIFLNALQAVFAVGLYHLDSAGTKSAAQPPHDTNAMMREALSLARLAV